MPDVIPNKPTEVQFNLGSTQLNLIGRMLERATSNWLIGNLDKAFHSMKRIRMLIRSRLNKEELVEYKSNESLMWLYLKKNDKFNASKTYELYEEKIMVSLEKYGFLIPLKQDKGFLYGQKD